MPDSYYNSHVGLEGVEMKKILILSDTHGDIETTKRIMRMHQDVDMRIHLGDVGFAFDELDNCYVVKGNHDHMAELPNERIFQIEDRKLLCVHGNLYDDEIVHEVLAMKHLPSDKAMKRCMQLLYTKLKNHAKEMHCDIVLFGHTHQQFCEESDDVLLINPGSICFGIPCNGYALVYIHRDEVKVKLLQC